MRSIVAGLCLSLIGGVALAQTPPDPAPAPKPPAPQPAPAGPAQVAPGPQAGIASPPGAPDGEIVETPNGFFLVRPGQVPVPLAIRPRAMAQGGMPADERTSAQPPASRPPAEGKGAHVSIHEPNLNVDVKCPDDEPVKVCIEAIGLLLDKATPQPHT